MLRVVGAELVWTGTREVPGGAIVCADGHVVEVVGPGPVGPAPADGRVVEVVGPGPVGPAGADGRVVAGGGPGVDASDVDVLDASGCVVTPGLVNAHHHLLQTAFRTGPHTRHLPMAAWLAAMADDYRALGVDAELVGAAAAAGLAESLLCGVTTVADHHLTWPSTAGDGVELALATASAARRLGARLVFVRGSAGDDPEHAALSADAIARALIPGRALTSGTGNHDGALTPGPRAGAFVPAAAPDVQVAVGPAGVHSDGEEAFRLLAEVAARHGLRRRTQANEVIDVDRAQERYGRRPLDLLDEWGWLAPDVTLAHLCAITPDEAARVAASGASATHAPGCDLPMGWGVAPAGDLLDRGVAVGLGTSGGGSNDAGHLLADARLAMQVAPLAGRPLTAREVLTMATTGSAAGLGRADLGTLEPGAAADLCCWDVTGVADAGVADPLAGLVWAAPGRRPRHVVVGGRVVVRDGELVADDQRLVGDRLRSLLARRRSWARL